LKKERLTKMESPQLGTLVDNEMTNPPLLVLASGGRFMGPPSLKVGRMADDDPSDEPQFQDGFILSAEEGALAELLGELQHGDWAHILFDLSPAAKDEIRAAIGKLHGEASYGREGK
jgi:hypothetical protein